MGTQSQNTDGRSPSEGGREHKGQPDARQADRKAEQKQGSDQASGEEPTHDSPPGNMTDRDAERGGSDAGQGPQDDKARQAGNVKNAPPQQRGSQSGKSDNPGTQPKH